MKKIITITLALTYISGILLAGTRQALTVFIGDYPTESGWYELASQNDKTLILNMLHSLNFDQKDIICLESRRDIQRNSGRTGGNGDQSKDW